MKAAAELLRSYVANLRDGDPVVWAEPYAPGKWKRVEVLGHLIDSASNNHQRFVRALLQDSIDLPAYDQEGCIRVVDPAGFGVERLLCLWVDYNLLIAHIMERIPASKLATPCRIGEAEAVTLEFLVNDYNAHLKHHLDQILG